VGRNTVVDGRAADPDRDRQRACTRSPGSYASAQILCDTGVENANDYFRSSGEGRSGSCDRGRIRGSCCRHRGSSDAARRGHAAPHV